MLEKAKNNQKRQDFRLDSSMKSKANTFLFEIIIVILFFSLCVAITLQLFTNSYLKSQLDKNTSIALLKTQTQAEIFKSIENSYEFEEKFKTAIEVKTGYFYEKHFDKNWEETDKEPRFIITVNIFGHEDERGLISADISAIEQTNENKIELVKFKVENYICS
ncbi:MAG: hypothetical protein RSA79_04385 [Oscillospiraceae bacterium]